MEGGRDHWDAVYRARPPDELGWYEQRPSTLPYVVALASPADAVVDVGGGDGRLVDELLAHGVADVTVLDLSEVALARARTRLGERAARVTWIAADVTTFVPTRTWAVWHDRAVFHFLVDHDDRRAYVDVAGRAVAAGGHAVIAAFATDGPDRCAGLPVRRYDVPTLAAELEPAFRLVASARIEATHEVGDRRPYVVVTLQRVGDQK